MNALRHVPALVVVASLIAGLSACHEGRLDKENAMDAAKGTIDETKARAIAHEDASQVYRDLGIYRIEAKLKDGNWHVDYELDGEAMAGGGPHYVISSSTGQILSRRYEQ